MSTFSDVILAHKYLNKDLGETSWDDVARRVAWEVVGKTYPRLYKEIYAAIRDKKFIPGGRYLYAAGRPYHQTQNCYSGETRVVTRDGTKELRELVGSSPILMSSGGNWVQSEVKSFGVQQLLKVTIRRAGKDKVLFATPEHSWRIAEAETSNRPTRKVEVTTQELKSGMRLWDVFGYGISRTPVSPAGVQHGVVFGDGNVPNDAFGFNTANVRLCGEKDTQLLPYFFGYKTRDIKEDIEVSGLPRRYKSFPSLHEDRSYLLGWLSGYFAADGCVSSTGAVSLSSANYENLEFVRDVCYLLGIGSYGITQTERISNLTNQPATMFTIRLMPHTLTEEFFLIESHRERFVNSPPEKRPHWNVVSVELSDRVEEVYCAVVPEFHEFVLEDNILTGNCLLLDVEDTRQAWADLLRRAVEGLSTGAGIGVVYSKIRPNGSPIRGMGGTATGPLALMQMLNESGRHIQQGGSRRSALWAGLHWSHSDVHDFIDLKNWSPAVRELKANDYNFPAPMDGTNISVILDDEFFAAYNNQGNSKHSEAHAIYRKVIKRMKKTGEPKLNWALVK